MLVDVLEEARVLGFLGPGPVIDHIVHADGFVAASPPSPKTVLDLGSGGGVPGLVLALRWPGAHVVLLDSHQRRTDFLGQAAQRLGVDDRITVLRARAEEAGRDTRWRGVVDLVTARSFGPPAVTAECAAPFLRVGGALVVSDPPEDAGRWGIAGLTVLGLAVDGLFRAQAGYTRMIQRSLCPDRYPRRVGAPAKRPLF